jgi:hypothetical protein
MAAWGGIFNKKASGASSASPSRSRRKPLFLEDQLQIACAYYLDMLVAADVLFFSHPPNELCRTKATGGKEKAMGMRAGEADLLIWPNKKYGVFPFFVELKTNLGKLQDSQKARHKIYHRNGYDVHVIYAANQYECVDKLKDVLRKYLIPTSVG